MNKRIYKKGDEEYSSNGHYIIDEVDWMTIDAFKQTFGINERNNPKANDEEGMVIYKRYESLPSKPDKGKIAEVYLYRTDDLAEFYAIN